MWELPVWQTDYNDKETYFLGMLEFSPQINLRSLPLSTFQWSNCCGQLGTWAHENRRQRALVKAYGADRALDRCFREERKTYTHIIASRYDTKYALLSKRKKRKGFKSVNLRFLVPLRPFFLFSVQAQSRLCNPHSKLCPRESKKPFYNHAVNAQNKVL